MKSHVPSKVLDENWIHLTLFIFNGQKGRDLYIFQMKTGIPKLYIFYLVPTNSCIHYLLTIIILEVIVIACVLSVGHQTAFRSHYNPKATGGHVALCACVMLLPVSCSDGKIAPKTFNYAHYNINIINFFWYLHHRDKNIPHLLSKKAITSPTMTSISKKKKIRVANIPNLQKYDKSSDIGISMDIVQRF